MLRTHFRPASVAVLAVLAAAAAGIAGCGTAGHGTAAGHLPRASTAGPANSWAARTQGPARHQRMRSGVTPSRAALPAAAHRRAYCVPSGIPVPVRQPWTGNCGGVACAFAAPAGSGPDRPGASTPLRPASPVPVLPCVRPLCCFCLPHWPLNGLNGNEALPGSRLLPAAIPSLCLEPEGLRGCWLWSPLHCSRTVQNGE